MNSRKQWAPCSALTVGHVTYTASGAWVVSGTLTPKGVCPSCGLQSRQRHGWRHRRLQDFPAHGNAVTVALRVWAPPARAVHSLIKKLLLHARLPDPRREWQ